jgi:SAM-dependent methyltransferase
VSFEFEARFFDQLLRRNERRPRRILVIGCGAGVEVGHLAAVTGVPVTGVDLTVDPGARRAGVTLLRADARALPFRGASVEAVYCYHVLEHVPEPERAVAEARRVLDARGLAYFGTPNRSRLVGYVGGRATLWEKVVWNLVDWWKRVRGQWENRHGAHAGFTDRELSGLLGQHFGRVESVSLPYYLGKYPGLAGFWRASFRLGLHRFLAPSVYFSATGEAGGRASGR